MARINRSLVDSIIEEVRLVTGESNDSGSVSDELLLSLLNRAQTEAAQLLARHYPEAVVTYTDIPIVANIQDYELPEDILEERVLKMEYIQSALTNPYPMERITFDSDEASYYTGSSTAVEPERYMQLGTSREVRVFPVPSGGGSLRMWYAKVPTDLVKSQGRIKSIVNATTIELDALGDEISSNQDEDGSHLCIVDGTTGAIKAVLEVAGINPTVETVITFSTTPITAEVEGIPVVACPDLTTAVNVGDYVCLAPFTCIPTIRQPILNYIKQYAIALVQTNLGAEHEVAYRALKDMQKFVEDMDRSKPNAFRVRMKSDAYGGNILKRNLPRPRS
jgi:hypothetical protein